MRRRLDPDLVDELMDLWLPIFVEGIDLTREALLGEEMPDARITVYTRRIGDRLAGACLVASSDSMPSLGGHWRSCDHSRRRVAPASQLL